MSYKDIDIILDKYWKGESTLKEEAQLKAYFQSEDISEDHLVYIELFAFIGEEQHAPKQLGKDFDAKILSQIQPETRNKVIPFTKSNFSRYWLTIAASLLFAVGVYSWGAFLNSTDSNGSNLTDTYSEKEAEIALQKTREALQLVSNKMNKGYTGYTQIGKFDEVYSSVKQF